MFRFFSVLWNIHDPAQVASARIIRLRLSGSAIPWQCGLDSDGLQVLHAGARPRSSEPYPMDGNRGVVLGKLFHDEGDSGRHQDARSCLLEHEQAELIVRSGGRHLVESFWGRYVAFIRDGQRGSCWVLRGPAGDLPCLKTTYNGVQLYFSCMADLVALSLVPLTVDWNYVATHMVASVQTKATGLNEVEEIQPGECVESRSGVCRNSFYWNPLRIAATNRIDSLADAAFAVRKTARACVHAWASAYDSIIHSLSGGLDSSVVLACLHDAPTRPRIACVNHYSAGAASDERPFARLAANRFGCPLIEVERSSNVDLRETLKAARFARPEGCVRRAEHSYAEAQLAAKLGAGAIITGAGGDELFHRNEPRFAAADFVYLHGIRPRLLRIAFEAALAERMSIWNVLSQALRHGIVKRDWDVLADVYQYRTLVCDDVLEAIKRARRCRPLWCSSTRDAPPGKLWHIYALSIPQNYYDPLGRDGDPEFVAPLLSQPLIELLLRIPTYVLKTDGWDRAVARRAFAQDLPPEIRDRRSKGGIEEHTGAVMRSNLEFLRAMLLDGLLVEKRLVDKARLAEALSDCPSPAWKGTSDVYRLLSIEIWLRAWVSYTTDAHVPAS